MKYLLMVLLLVGLFPQTGCFLTKRIPLPWFQTIIGRVEIEDISIIFNFTARTITVDNTQGKQKIEISIQRWDENLKSYKEIFAETIGEGKKVRRKAIFKNTDIFEAQIKIGEQKIIRGTITTG